MSAASIIAGWKRRLITLAENPPYVFRDTPKHLIDQHERRLTTFAGYTESEVADAEAQLRAIPRRLQGIPAPDGQVPG